MTDPKSEPSEQDAFEAWYGFEEANHVAAWERDAAGGYHSYYVQVAWESWQARAALTPAPAQPEPPTAAGVGPVAWRVRYRSEPGMLGNYPWAYEERRPRREHQSLEIEPLYTTPPTLTDAQCDAARYRDTLKEIADMTFDPWTNGAKAGELALRALIRAAAAGGA